MRRFVEMAAMQSRGRFQPLSAFTLLLVLVLVLSSWRPAVASIPGVPSSPAMTCGDTGDHASRCNDPAGVMISVSHASATEGTDATLDFEVSLSKPHPSRSVTMDWSIADYSGTTAVAGEDYTDASGTLTFASGETTKTIRISLLDDAASEGVETLYLTLANASGATFVHFGKAQPVFTAIGTILPDEDTTTPPVAASRLEALVTGGRPFDDAHPC